MTRVLPRAVTGILLAAVLLSFSVPPARADKGYADFSIWNRSQFSRDPLDILSDAGELVFSLSAAQDFANFGTVSLRTDGLFSSGSFRLSRFAAGWTGFKFGGMILTANFGDETFVATNLESRFMNEFHPYIYYRGLSGALAAPAFDLSFYGGKIARLTGLFGSTYSVKDQPFYGIQGRWKIRPTDIVGAAIFHTRNDPADDPAASTNTLLSADAEAEVLPGGKILGEFRTSLTPGEAGPAGSANEIRFGPIFRSGKWDVEANYRFTGSRFLGLNPETQYNRDQRGVFGSVRYQLSRALTLFAVADRFSNNTDDDPAVNALASTSLTSGFYLNTRSLLDLSAQTEFQRRLSENPSENGVDYSSRALFVQASKTMGDYFPYLRVRLEYSRESVVTTGHYFTPSVFLGVRRTLASGSYYWAEGEFNQRAGQEDGIIDRNFNLRAGWDKIFSPNFSLYSELFYELSGPSSAYSQIVAYVSARLGLGKTIELNIDFRASEPLNHRDIRPSDYQFTFRVNKRFSWGLEGKVLGRKSFAGNVATGTIDGVVFEDLNGDGVAGLGEKGLPGVALYLEDGSKTSTGPDGRFRFAGVAEGPHRVRVEESAIPAYYYLLGPVRVDVLIQPRVTRQISFPLIAGGNVSGRVIEDTDRDGQADPEDKGLGDILILLTPAAKKAEPEAAASAEIGPTAQNTYSAPDGTYRFVNIFPGEYELSLDPETLPTGAAPAGTLPLRISIKPGGSITSLDILVTPRPVIRKK